MHRASRSAILPLFLFSCLVAKAQKPSIDDFTVSGDTYRTGGNCFQLTRDANWSGGSIWHRTPIDLASPFSMELRLMFGCKDAAGADGMVFVFTPTQSGLGRQGEGMGFAGLVPSLGIEFDTWENEHLGDPPVDHVALLANGQVSHFDNLMEPVSLPNVEDCRPHQVKVDWNPAEQRLTIRLDGKVVLAAKADLIGRIFRGNTRVYWGVTSATGMFNNRHEICFDKIAYVAAPEGVLEFDPATVKKLLAGEILPLQKLQYAAGSSDLQPASYAELERIANLMKKYPRLSLDIFSHTDDSGEAAANLALSRRRAQALADHLMLKGIAPGRLTARGFGEQYPLAPNATAEGRLKNRRIEVRLSKPPVP